MLLKLSADAGVWSLVALMGRSNHAFLKYLFRSRFALHKQQRIVGLFSQITHGKIWLYSADACLGTCMGGAESMWFVGKAADTQMLFVPRISQWTPSCRKRMTLFTSDYQNVALWPKPPLVESVQSGIKAIRILVSLIKQNLFRLTYVMKTPVPIQILYCNYEQFIFQLKNTVSSI